jgi:hypothetical protein
LAAKAAYQTPRRGVAGVEPPQRGVGRNEVRPRGETSPPLLCLLSVVLDFTAY